MERNIYASLAELGSVYCPVHR